MIEPIPTPIIDTLGSAPFGQIATDLGIDAAKAATFYAGGALGDALGAAAGGGADAGAGLAGGIAEGGADLGAGLAGGFADAASGVGDIGAGLAGSVPDAVSSGVAAGSGAAPGAGSLAGTASAASGATPAAAVDPFNLPTGAVAGGAPVSGLPGGVENAGQLSQLTGGATSGIGDGAIAAPGTAGPIVDPASASSWTGPPLTGTDVYGQPLSSAGLSGATPAIGGADGVGGVNAPLYNSIDDLLASGNASAPSGGGLGGISDFIKQNKELLGLGLGGANIAKSAFGGANQGSNQAALQQLLQQLQHQYQQLQSGQLTPEQQQLFQNNLEATMSKIKATYASHGMGGRSTAAMEDMAAAQSASTAGKAQTVTQNLNTGLQAAGLTGRTAESLLTNELTQDAQLSQAIARLAAAGLA